MISIPSIIAAGIKRYVPGCLWFFGAVFVISAGMKEMTIGPAQIGGFAELTLSMFAGYVAGLVATRSKIAGSARIDGSRSKLAGFASPVILLGIGVLHRSPTPRLLNCAFAVVAGAVTTVLLFAPWMTAGARLSASTEDATIDAAESILADRSPLKSGARTTQPTKTPRQISAIRAD